MKKEIIMYDSPEAAKIVTLTGWLSRTGQFYGSDINAEHLARWTGCTHKKCEKCGEIIEIRGYCSPCHTKWRREQWEKMPVVVWDGECMLHDYDGDRFWSSPDDFFDWCADEGIERPSEIMLVATESHHLGHIDSDHWQDDLPDDGELPDEVLDAINALNKVLERQGPISWRPIDKRIVIAVPSDYKIEP